MLNRLIFKLVVIGTGILSLGSARASFDFGGLSLDVPESDSESDNGMSVEPEWMSHRIGKGANKSAFWDAEKERVVYTPHSTTGCGEEYDREIDNILFMESRDYFSFQGMCQYAIDPDELIEAPLYSSDLKKEIARPRFLHPRDERKVIVSILRAVQKLNIVDLYHFDIKPDNFFVDADGDLFLGDFGSLWSGELVGTAKGFSKYIKNIRRTMKYSAPEIETFDRDLKVYKELDPGQFTIWSAGITALELHAKWNGKSQEFKNLSKYLSNPFSKTKLSHPESKLMQQIIDDIVDHDPKLNIAFKHLLAPYGSRSLARALWYLETVDAFQKTYDTILNQMILSSMVLL